jgi:thiamine-phosphate pyrophosphorylase
MDFPVNKRIRGLYAIIDTSYVPFQKAGRQAREILSAGVGIVQLRAKGAGSGELLEAARLIRMAAREAGALFIVNDRVDVAILTDADGVHLGQDDIPVEAARGLLGKEKIIGFSTHNMEEVNAADELARSGFVDYISFGPLFPTTTKPDARAPVGLTGLREARKRTTLPITAIGGITPENVEEVLAEGPAAVAMISSILKAKDVQKRTSELVEKINGFSGRSNR